MASVDKSGWPAIAATGPKQAAHPLSFIVIGAGVSGLGSAVALKRAGHRVTLLECMNGLDLSPEHARGLRLPPNMTKIMNRWGYGDRLDKIGITTQRMGFFRLETGEMLGSHSRLVRDLVHDAGGGFFLTEHHRFLALLLDIAKDLNADIRFGCRVIHLGAEGNSVVLESGETLQADVVVGADGVGGPCSSAVEPNGADNQSEIGFMTYCSVVPADKIKQDPELVDLVLDAGEGITNWLWYGDKCAAMTFPTSADGDCALYIWLPDEGAGEAWGDVVDEEIVKHTVAALKAQPRLRKLASLAPVTRIKTVSRPPLKDCIHPSKNMIVIGEAAHPSPRGLYFGPGMSLEDAAALAKLFTHALEHAQIPVFLNAFSELRQARCMRMISIDSQSLAYMTISGPTAEVRDAEFRERTAASLDVLLPMLEDTMGTSKMWDDNREMFGYDAEDAGDQWWVEWGLPTEHARGIDLSANIKLGETTQVEE